MKDKVRLAMVVGILATLLVAPGLFPAPAGAPAPAEPASLPEPGPAEAPPAACCPHEHEAPAGPVKTAYLTFDDGPSEVTLDILDILGDFGVPATFFVCGNHWDFGRNAYRRMLDEGHAIGNHSYTHNLTRIYASAAAFWADFDRLQHLLEEATGDRPPIMRFPGGSNNRFARRELMDELLAGLEERGIRYFDWNVCSGDSAVLGQDPEVIIRRVLDGVRGLDEAVILFHDSYSRATTVTALPVILEALLADGFAFRTLGPDSTGVQFPR
ncbi:MAG: polysaccharide deacetylase family protein [bacterium]|nr:polysaccharide deacetylase family protein [bacterium]